jgi:hypothetical protein
MAEYIVFARIQPSELDIITTENNKVINLGLCCQIRDPETGDDLWQAQGGNVVGQRNMLSWTSFVESFYGGGNGDFSISQVAGRSMTMIGVSGEFANGVPQAGSALTHLSDRGRTDQSGSGNSSQVSISGVSVLNDVTSSIVNDLGLPHDAWDSCSYMNVVNQLQGVHSVQDATKIVGNTGSTCSLSLESLVHEIASSYDGNLGIKAKYTASALNKLYTGGMRNAILTSLSGTTANSRKDLAFTILFKSSTPGVKNVEFRIHLLVSNLSGNQSLEELCKYSSESAHFLLDGTQF